MVELSPSICNVRETQLPEDTEMTEQAPQTDSAMHVGSTQALTPFLVHLWIIIAAYSNQNQLRIPERKPQRLGSAVVDVS